MAIDQDHSARHTHWRPERVEIIDGQPVRFSDICVHEFRLGDVEDPELYLAEPVLAWQNSEAGEWVMANAEERPYWIKNLDAYSYSYQIRIMARLSEHNQTFFQLKWGKQ